VFQLFGPVETGILICNVNFCEILLCLRFICHYVIGLWYNSNVQCVEIMCIIELSSTVVLFSRVLMLYEQVRRDRGSKDCGTIQSSLYELIKRLKSSSVID